MYDTIIYHVIWFLHTCGILGLLHSLVITGSCLQQHGLTRCTVTIYDLESVCMFFLITDMLRASRSPSLQVFDSTVLKFFKSMWLLHVVTILKLDTYVQFHWCRQQRKSSMFVWEMLVRKHSWLLPGFLPLRSPPLWHHQSLLTLTLLAPLVPTRVQGIYSTLTCECVWKLGIFQLWPM